MSTSFKEFSSSLSLPSPGLKSPFPDVSRGITPFLFLSLGKKWVTIPFPKKPIFSPSRFRKVCSFFLTPHIKKYFSLTTPSAGPSHVEDYTLFSVTPLPPLN